MHRFITYRIVPLTLLFMFVLSACTQSAPANWAAEEAAAVASDDVSMDDVSVNEVTTKPDEKIVTVYKSPT